MAAGRHANNNNPRREFSHQSRHRSNGGVHEHHVSSTGVRDEERRSGRYRNDLASVGNNRDRVVGYRGEDVKEVPLAKKRKFSPITWGKGDEEKLRAAVSKDKLDDVMKRDAVVVSKKFSSNGDVCLDTVCIQLNDDVCDDHVDSANKLQEFESSVKTNVDVEFRSGSAESTLTESPTICHLLHQAEVMIVDTDIKNEDVLDEDDMQVDDEDHRGVLPVRKSRWATLDDTPVRNSSGHDESGSGKLRSGVCASAGKDSRTSSPECGEFIRDDSVKSRSRSSSEEKRENSSMTDGEESDLEFNDADTQTEDAEGQTVEVPKNVIWDSCRDVFDYEKLNKINEGTYGVVFRARNKKTGEIVALKKVKLEGEREGFPVTALREIKFLMSVDHPSLVRGKEVVMGDLDSVFVVMEYMEHDLKGVMEMMKHPFSTSQVKCLMLQLLEGIKYLHDNWVIHRDLKSSNILFNNQGELKICDFGMARQYANPLKPYTKLVVTLWYRAPELLFGAEQYSEAVDMWSVGCIMAELINKEPLFQGKTEVDQIDKILRTLGTPDETIWPGFSKLPGAKAKFVKHPYNNLRKKFPVTSFTGAPTLSSAGFDLLSGLLTYDPAKRLTVHEALNHPWFHEVPMAASKEFMPTFPAQNAHDRTKKSRR